MARFRLSPAAEQDLETILAWTHEQCGEGARLRYEALLVQAIVDVAADSERADSQPRPELAESAFTYHVAFSRDHVTAGGRVRRPRRRKILFPNVQDSSCFLDDFAAEVAEYDSDMRSIRYTHPGTQPDDALHATNYAVQVAARVHYGVQRYAE